MMNTLSRDGRHIADHYSFESDCPNCLRNTHYSLPMTTYSRKVAYSFFKLMETATLFLGLVLAITPLAPPTIHKTAKYSGT